MGAAVASGGWMLRHARQMRTDPLTFLVDCAAELGDVVEFPIPRARVLYVNDPDAALRVLQGNHRAYGKRTIQYDALSLVTGDGLLTSDGAVWRRSRRLIQPAFHPRTLDAVAGHVAAAGERLIAGWSALPDGAQVDVDEAMMRVALEVVGAALFSADLGPQAQHLVQAVLEALEVVVARARSPLPLPLAVPTPGHRRLRRAVATLDATVADLVARRRAVEGGVGESGADLLGLLLAARDGADALSDRQLRDEVVTLVVAGHETVASALTWTWWLLADAPEVADRLAEESDRVLGGRPPSVADYPELRYARAVFDEALRLYPPAWVITRRALEPDVLAGAEVPAGALVILSTYALHRHPAVWPDPERFDPERFAGAATVRRGYLPFGAGPRLCVGRDFALLEGTLLLAQVGAAYRLRRTAGQRVRPEALVTIRPHGGLPLRLFRRR